uniref:TRP C-terminal domain-containing protein n=1 Tax=Chromera velia CCMP2878 TaxID=1169474 RepID=A0A0G4HB12_9ALVE|eukprot:Cvel_25707.t1-p1 / transcript=Cvel_25707.t1 / gene=Cvel_25707 / organism=Chromera_velia_CCMP2878 / gene_product=hypothetical protein / transcript_product=hypothetical protein / location=Cvel_scaffold2950:14535-17947(-) / protein_length=533 / sequence_SO=supercontig / SO=protein_coding / is_pseudo=false
MWGPTKMRRRRSDRLFLKPLWLCACLLFAVNPVRSFTHVRSLRSSLVDSGERLGGVRLKPSAAVSRKGRGDGFKSLGSLDGVPRPCAQNGGTQSYKNRREGMCIAYSVQDDREGGPGSSSSSFVAELGGKGLSILKGEDGGSANEKEATGDPGEEKGETLPENVRSTVGALLAVLILAFAGSFCISSGVRNLNVAVDAANEVTGSVFDPKNFSPVCGASDNFYRALQGAVISIAGQEAYEQFGPLIAGALLRIRLELCVLESFFYEALVPFIREKGLSWVLPAKETPETFLAGTVFSLASNFVLIGSTKALAVLATYLDFFVGVPLRLVGGGFSKLGKGNGGVRLFLFSVGALMNGVGKVSEIFRRVIESLDLFAGRYLLILTTVYVIVKFLHFRVFPDFPNDFEQGLSLLTSPPKFEFSLPSIPSAPSLPSLSAPQVPEFDFSKTLGGLQGKLETLQEQLPSLPKTPEAETGGEAPPPSLLKDLLEGGGGSGGGGQSPSAGPLSLDSPSEVESGASSPGLGFFQNAQLPSFR